MNTIAQRDAIKLLKANSERCIYEAGTPNGKSGCGRYFITYCQHSPELRKDDIDALLRGGVIREKFPYFYELTA